MLLRTVALLSISISLFLIAMAAYALVDPYDVKLAMYDLVSSEEAANWANSWNRAAIHILIGGVLTLSAAIGMWCARRWSMILLCIACIWLLLFNWPSVSAGQILRSQNTAELIGIGVLTVGAILSIVLYARWNHFAPSPNE